MSEKLSTLFDSSEYFVSFSGKRAFFRGAINADTLVVNAPIHWVTQTDTGSNYDANTGVYLVPYSGVYTINYQLYSQQGARFDLDLYKNGAVMLREDCDSSDVSTCTT